MDDEQLFERMATEQWNIQVLEFEKMEKEFIAFFSSYKDCNELISLAIEKVGVDNTLLDMLSSIRRFALLAEKIKEMEENTDQARIFLLISLSEALYNLASGEKRGNSRAKVQKFFTNFLQEDTELVTNNFRMIFDNSRLLSENNRKLTVNSLANLFYELRNQFAHEGISYEFHFASEDGETKFNALQSQNKRDTSTYEVKLTFIQFRDVIVRMGIRCTEHYAKGMPEETEFELL